MSAIAWSSHQYLDNSAIQQEVTDDHTLLIRGSCFQVHSHNQTFLSQPYFPHTFLFHIQPTIILYGMHNAATKSCKDIYVHFSYKIKAWPDASPHHTIAFLVIIKYLPSQGREFLLWKDSPTSV